MSSFQFSLHRAICSVYFSVKTVVFWEEAYVVSNGVLLWFCKAKRVNMVISWTWTFASIWVQPFHLYQPPFSAILLQKVGGMSFESPNHTFCRCFSCYDTPLIKPLSQSWLPICLPASVKTIVCLGMELCFGPRSHPDLCESLSRSRRRNACWLGGKESLLRYDY